MNINDRIIIDDNELFQFLESKLDSLTPFIYNSKYKALLGDNIIDKIKSWNSNIRKQKDTPLTVVVCGEFKRGKSSLINAILGETVVTTNITTETITVNRISYGEYANEIVLNGGKRIRLADEELCCDKLQHIIREISQNDKITMLELKRPLDALKDLTIIDTPGLGDSIKDFSAEVNYALNMADVVIYVFSVLYPMSANEQYFIKTAIKPQKYTELMLVGNYCDSYESAEDLDRMTAVVCDRIKDILPGEKPLMISALDERCRQLGSPVPNEAVSEILYNNFQTLRTNFNDILTSKRAVILPDRIQRMINSMTIDLQKDIDSINLGLSMSTEELNKKRQEAMELKLEHSNEQNKVFETIDKYIELHRSRALSWIDNFIDCMESDVNNLSSIDINDIKKYYPIFCVDALQQAITKCSDYFVDALYTELEKVSSEVTRKLSMGSADEKISFSFTLDNKVWTAGDNLQFASTEVVKYIPFYSLISPVTTFIAGALREHELKKNAPDVVNSIKKQYPALRSNVVPAITEKFNTIGDNAKKQLLEYFGEKNDELDAELKQSELIVRQDSDKKAEIEVAVNEIAAILEAIKSELAV
ncbi:MAG: dynamin family protein [Clostridia bacterium]|nr:dynamin family protein [Clostridia bacterium]